MSGVPANAWQHAPTADYAPAPVDREKAPLPYTKWIETPPTMLSQGQIMILGFSLVFALLFLNLKRIRHNEKKRLRQVEARKRRMDLRKAA